MDFFTMSSGTLASRLAIASTGAATFSSSVTATGGFFNGNGSFTNNGFWGTLITAGTGTYSDFAIIDNTSTQIMRVPTGTRSVVFSSSVTAAQFLATSNSNAAIITSTGTTGYGLVAVGSSGGARDILLAGQSGFSNGFTVQYNGSAMVYGFQSGNVGIGVGVSAWASGTTALQIGTTGTLWNRASDGLFILGSNSYYNGSADIQITTGTSNRMYFLNGGITFDRAASAAAGSNTSWNNTMTMSANGSIGAPSGTNIYNASDIRLKQNISTITDGLSKIIALNPVKFNWIDDFESSENGKELLGFIAQEVQGILPEAVENFGGSSLIIGETVIENPLRVNEKFIIPVLVKALQEANAKITALEEKLERNNII
jgi:hypothetical protein